MATNSEESYPWQGSETITKRGAFIVIEGLDRAGKTTQVKKLCDRLYSEGHNVKAIRFPDRTSPIGKMIDQYLQSKTPMEDHVIHLLFSANRWEKAQFIISTLNSGYTVVCDRYTHSGMVYSAAKFTPDLSLSWAQAPEVGLPLPDAVVFLDLKTEDAEKRGGFGEERYEKKEMQMRVREIFLELVDGGNEGIEIVDAGSGVDVVQARVWECVKGVVESGRDKVLGRVKVWENKS